MGKNKTMFRRDKSPKEAICWRITWRLVLDPVVDIVTSWGVLLGRWGLDTDNL